MAIAFHDHNVKSGLKDRRKLSAFLHTLIQDYRKIAKVKIDYIFCSDEYLLEINQQFLQHDSYTDIITFDLSASDKELQGEIYISIDRVHENAQRYAANYNEELHRVIFHGVLHLCGFQDKSKTAQEKMREEENKCLAAYFRK